MLSRFMSIDDDGCYSMNGDPRVLFSTMLLTRAQIFGAASLGQLVVCLLCVRYSIVRRQFRKNKDEEENQLIDY